MRLIAGKYGILLLADQYYCLLKEMQKISGPLGLSMVPGHLREGSWVGFQV